MKKMILSAFILVAIISLGVLSLNLYDKTSQKLSGMIDGVSEAVAAGDWDGANTGIENIEKVWSKTEGTWALLIDHFEIDNIEMSLKKSKEYIETKNTTLSLAELATLNFMVEHIYKKEALNFENIF